MKTANKTKTKNLLGSDASPREQLILYALYNNSNTELYGLQIPQAIEEASGGRNNMQLGTLYPALHSLEKKGLVESRWGDAQRAERGGARRRYYRLTDSGIKEVNTMQSFQSNLLSWQAT